MSTAYGSTAAREEGAPTLNEPLVSRAIDGAGLSTRTKVLAALGGAAVAIAAAVALGVTLSRKPATIDDGCSYSGYRLQPNFSPSFYDIRWRVSFADPYPVVGSTALSAKAIAGGQRCVQVHSHPDVTIASVSVNGQVAPAWRGDSVNERLVVSLPFVTTPNQQILLQVTDGVGKGRGGRGGGMLIAMQPTVGTTTLAFLIRLRSSTTRTRCDET